MFGRLEAPRLNRSRAAAPGAVKRSDNIAGASQSAHKNNFQRLIRMVKLSAPSAPQHL
jgi:hypothetical protein